MARKNLTQQIMHVVSDRDYQPRTVDDLARAMGLAAEQLGEYHDAVRALHRKGRVVIGSHDMVLPPVPPGKVIGTYRGNPRGFGFIVPEAVTAHGDLFVPPGQQLDAVTGDTVLAQVRKRGKRDGSMRYCAEVVRVLNRGNSQYVGRLRKSSGRWFVIPDGNALNVPVFIKDVGAKKAQPDAQVVIEIIQYPGVDTEARGVIVEVLGDQDEPQVDLLSIIHQYNLPHEFPQECLDQARQQSRSFRPQPEAENRDDLTDLTIVTIDPDDARDFDDAISLTHEHGQWELGVHIADVAHFVTPGSALDEEARLRGNSVYFPGYVIPMLPEVLSNGVCSLQEEELRFVKSAFITYNDQGRVITQRFANSAIRSSRRFTYDEVTHILAGRTGGTTRMHVDLLKRMERLARIIQQRRFDEGMIALDLPGVEVVLDELGRCIDVKPEDQSFSHTIIEMFMVEANEAVAQLLTQLGVPHIRRVHADPDPSSDERVAPFLKALGLGLARGLERKQIQSVLEKVKGTPQAFSVNLAILRSMQQAEYSPQLIGHYALASQHYTHFTSPIRRYPDLTIHRLLDHYLNGQLDDALDGLVHNGVEQLRALGAVCSYTERRAEDAERELKLIMILRLLEERIGEEFKGIVTGVTNFGLFVQLETYLVEGLIRFESLSDDWWEVIPQAGCIVGQRSGRRLCLGDVLKVSLISVDIPARRMDLRLLEQLSKRGRIEPVDTGRSHKKSQRKRRRSKQKKSQTRRKQKGKRRRAR